jgi:hypothetical protein
MSTAKKDRTIEKEVHLLMAYKDDYDAVCEILAKYSLPMLMKIAAKLHDMKHSDNRYPHRHMTRILEHVLCERKGRLNINFELTDENKARFLFVSDQLYEASAKGWQEAIETAGALEKRIKQKDSFLKDYEICIRLQAYPRVSGERKAAETIRCYLAEETLDYIDFRVGHSDYKNLTSGKGICEPINIDKSKNWNIEHFGGKFDNAHICYAIHWMLHTNVWSCSDIMSIDHIWVDVEITHQYETKIPKLNPPLPLRPEA